MKKIVSFSGGKDSTAMLLKLLKDGYQVDDIVFFNTGWEFAEMEDHIKKVQDHIKRPIAVLHPNEPFDYIMTRRPIKKRSGPHAGKVYRHGNGWPSMMRRWCTRKKIDTINKYCKTKYGKEYQHYVGYAADEIKRMKPDPKKLYPLFQWSMTESDCLQYCYDAGFNWGGLYRDFSRVSCFCCPLQRINDFRILRTKRPQLWAKMLEMDKGIKNNRGFYGYKTVRDMDKRFKNEEMEVLTNG